MMRGRWFVALALVVLQAPRESAAGRIGVVPSRPDTLYSGSNANPSCTDLFNVQDDTMLPLNVVRLRAQQPAGVAPDQVRYQWSFPKPALGQLLADEDLGPDEQVPAIRSACADVGNGCVLTAEQLLVYNHPSILWVAPGCDVLPTDTTRPFRGGTVRIGVRVSVGKRRVGRGAGRIGFGRIGSLTLFVADPGGPFRDGIGNPSGEKIFLNPLFAVRLDPGGLALPKLDTINID